jgi:hypothetical protein
VATAAYVSAHRRDEYLQAARIAIEPDAVQLELNMTPGIELADAIVAEIDRNRDGSLSPDEQRAYAAAVLGALTLEVDGTPVRTQLTAATFPDVDTMKRGEGSIRMQLAGTLPRLSAGAHALLFRNRHRRDRSVYLANALVPASPDVTVTAQRRDVDQTELTIDYLLRAAPPRPNPAWLLALAVAVLLSGLLISRQHSRSGKRHRRHLRRNLQSN